MPGWILVANRSSFLSTFGKSGSLLGAVLSLAYLVVLTGCSNLRQQSLESSLSVLPSRAAIEADKISAPALPLGEAHAVVTGGSVDGNSGSAPSALENDFDIGFKQTEKSPLAPPTRPSYPPSENDFQPPQLQARFVGVLDKAEMSEVKLKAVSKIAPAPPIETAMAEATVENCKTPEACCANTSGQCACCKKKELPQLAVVEPIDPAQLPKLFGSNSKRANNEIEEPSSRSMLQPLRSTNTALETNVASKADVDSPIRLTAMQGSEIPQTRLPFIAAPAKTQNRAQLLFPIAPDKSKEIKAEAKLVTTHAAEILETNSDIKVGPIINLNSVVADEASTGVVAAAVDSPVDSNKTQAEFIPVSPSGIRVSSIPFKSLSPAMPKPVRVATKSAVPIEVANVFQGFEPEVSDTNAVFAAARSRSNSFVPLPTKPVKVLPVVSADVAPLKKAIAKEKAKATENQFVSALPPANIDPLAEYGDLPDMSQIEKELAEFKKDNTFDPSTVSHVDKIDPAVLLAKLDGPPQKIPAPVVKIVETAPDKNLLRQQLEDQSTKLSDLQDAIEQLKSKPEPVVHQDPALTLSNAAFCTKITGFGQFTPFSANTFSGSQKTLLYCEVENQTSKRFTGFDGSDQFETVLHGSVVIYDANDRVVQTEKFPAIKDIARQQRKDFYVYFPVQFNELARGDYRLELSVEDVAGNETTVLRPFMRFSVK